MVETNPYRPPILAGVVGYPVAHSLSPLIHTIWAARAGIAGHYIPLAVEANYGAFARVMDALRTIGFAGVNITIPHKEHALRYADNASEIAKTAGAANMLSFDGQEAVAENSDVSGFSAALSEKLAPDEKINTAMILGAGGAARGVVLALQGLGVKTFKVANRTRSKAQALCDLAGSAELVDWEDRHSSLGEADLLVNTTSLGMVGQRPLEIDLTDLHDRAMVADIVYSPLKTPLLTSAAKMGRITIDGLSMLMHQAAPGFRTWFGGEAVADASLRQELVMELTRKRRT